MKAAPDPVQKFALEMHFELPRDSIVDNQPSVANENTGSDDRTTFEHCFVQEHSYSDDTPNV